MDENTAPEESLVPENDNLPDVADLPPEAFFHWYNFAFIYGGPNGSRQVNVHWGFDEMKITERRIANVIHHVAPDVDPRGVVLLAVSYLGFMTRDEFNA